MGRRSAGAAGHGRTRSVGVRPLLSGRLMLYPGGGGSEGGGGWVCLGFP